jgi:hypothetical protein
MISIYSLIGKGDETPLTPKTPLLSVGALLDASRYKNMMRANVKSIVHPTIEIQASEFI